MNRVPAFVRCFVRSRWAWLAAGAVLWSVLPARAQFGYTLERTAVVNGGELFAVSATNNFQLSGTVGQPVAAYSRDFGTNLPPFREMETGLWIHDTPQYFDILRSTNDFMFTFDTALGAGYVVEYSDSLNPPNWLPLQTYLGDGTVKTATNTVTTGGQRYYRLREQ